MLGDCYAVQFMMMFDAGAGSGQEARRGWALDSMWLVVRSGSLVRSDVPGVVLDVLAARDAFALATLIKALLVAARVLARVRQTVDAADVHRSLQPARRSNVVYILHNAHDGDPGRPLRKYRQRLKL